MIEDRKPEFCDQRPGSACKLFVLEHTKAEVDGAVRRVEKRLDSLDGRVQKTELDGVEMKTAFKDLKEFIQNSQKKQIAYNAAVIAGMFGLGYALLPYVLK